MTQRYNAADVVALFRVAQHVGDCREILWEVSEFLDNYVDVLDGDDGEPRPNRAMSLKQRVDELLD